MFTSSHKEVVNEFAKYDNHEKDYTITIIAPNISLESEWVKKLEYRWYDTNEHKDYAAYQDANKNFKEEVDWLFLQKFIKVAISEMTYDLSAVIDGLIYLYN